MGLMRDTSAASLAALSTNAVGTGGKAVVRGVLGLGLYPQVGRLAFAYSGKTKRSAATILTRKGEKVRINLSSVNAKLEPPMEKEVGSEGSEGRGPRPDNNTLVVEHIGTNIDCDNIHIQCFDTTPCLSHRTASASSAATPAVTSRFPRSRWPLTS